MNARQSELRERRARLVERAASERAELTGLMSKWEGPLLGVDRCLSLLSALRSMPWLRVGVGAGMAALAFARPRSILGWVVGGQAAWRLLTRIRRMVQPAGK